MSDNATDTDCVAPVQSTDHVVSEVDPRAIGGRVDEMPKGYYLSPNSIGTYFGAGFATAACFISVVLPTNILQIINDDIGPDPSYVWIPLVWTLCVSFSYALLGRLSDILGRRWFVVGANSLGLVGAIIAATAHRIPVIIGGTALIGIAGAVQLSLPVFLGELVANSQRPLMNSTLFSFGIPWGAFGPVIARLFVLHTKAGWRWCYYLNIIFGGLSTLLLVLFYHPPTLNMLHAREKRRIISYLDIGGICLFVVGLSLFILGFSWGGQEYSWRSGQVIGCIVAGSVILIVFVLYEIYVPLQYPLMPARLWKNSGYVGTVLTASAGAMIYYSMNVIWPTQISSMYTTNLLEIGWISCANGGGTILGNILGAFACKYLGRQKYQLIICTIFMTSFVGGMAGTTPESKGMATAFVAIAAFFVGAIEGITSTTVPLCLEPEDLGLAIGMLGSIRTSMSTIATAVYVAILSSRLDANLATYVGAVAQQTGTSQALLQEALAAFSSGTLEVPSLSNSVIQMLYSAYKEAYSLSFQTVYLTSIAFGVLSIGAAFMSPNLEHRFTDQVARRMHGTETTEPSEKKNETHEHN